MRVCRMRHPVLADTLSEQPRSHRSRSVPDNTGICRHRRPAAKNTAQEEPATSRTRRTMDQVALVVVRAVESGATTTKDIIGATGLSRLKVERALGALEKQKLLFRERQGSWALGIPVAPTVRQCGSCTLCCKVLEVTDLGKLVNTVCNHIRAGGGCDIYNERPGSAGHSAAPGCKAISMTTGIPRPRAWCRISGSTH
ncbi:hypothetical protein ACVIGB_002288 [Bradyrhizobium sp. USDA 4341]